MPASTTTVAQWVSRTIQWWRRTVAAGVAVMAAGETCGHGPIPATVVRALPRPPCPALACRPMTQTRHSAPALPERIGGLAARAANPSWGLQRHAPPPFRTPAAAPGRRPPHQTTELL